MKTPTPTTYLDNDQLPYLFCPGCGHGLVLDHLNKALLKLSLDPHKVVIITDIGCAGLSDRYFSTNAFHGLHGRSVTYASGIKLANPELNVIVLIGDGGCGIGGHHIINAARRNIDVTVLVFNNFNYGMTGGQHSVTTPAGGVTSTTKYGQIEKPLDICGTVAINGASFVARTSVYNKSTPDIITKAIQNEGFSILDIWEMCTAHYVPNNRFSRKALNQLLDELEFKTGILVNEPKPDFRKLYKETHAEIIGNPAMVGNPIPTKYSNKLNKPTGILLAGAAGTKINSAASLFGSGAILSGLWVSQRDDYPVMVKAGHSISEIMLSSSEISFTNLANPELIIALFPEGLAKIGGFLDRLTEKDTLIMGADLPEPETKANKIMISFKDLGGIGSKKEYRAVIALTIALRHFGYYPLEAFKEAVRMEPRFSKDNLSAVEQAADIET